jgi:4-amino-4-deoxy-L-arabinose transferase-like glycosyltransferase
MMTVSTVTLSSDLVVVVQASDLGSIIGSLPMFLSFYLYDSQDMTKFRVFAFSLSLLSCILIWYARLTHFRSHHSPLPSFLYSIPHHFLYIVKHSCRFAGSTVRENVPVEKFGAGEQDRNPPLKQARVTYPISVVLIACG